MLFFQTSRSFVSKYLEKKKEISGKFDIFYEENCVKKNTHLGMVLQKRPRRNSRCSCSGYNSATILKHEGMGN